MHPYIENTLYAADLLFQEKCDLVQLQKGLAAAGVRAVAHRGDVGRQC